MKPFLLISSDCHAGAPWEGYRPYVERRYLDRYDDWVAGKKSAEVETRAWRRSHFPQEFRDRYDGRAEAKIGRPSDMAWDVAVFGVDERIRLLEDDGVVSEVLFPDNSRRNAVPFRARNGIGGVDLDLVAAGSRAYNRWLADFCSQRPERHIGIALIHMGDMGAALAETRWAKGAGMRGILIPTGPEGERLPAYDHSYYEPVWALCEDLDLPIHTHGGGGDGRSIFGRLVSGGVFDRYPRLRVVWTEQGADWIPAMLKEQDALYDHPGRETPAPPFPLREGRGVLASDNPASLISASTPFPLREGGQGVRSLKPSEYWTRNCWVGHSTRHIRPEWELRHAIGVDKMMWGHDFPHPEGAWPYATEAIHVCFTGMPEAEQRCMLGETAARLYGIDVAKLIPAVERVGPRLRDP